LNYLYLFFLCFLEFLQTIVFFTTIGVIIAAAYYLIASLPVSVQMESTGSSNKNLIFIGIFLGALIFLDAWFYSALGAPLFLREYMYRAQPGWNQSISMTVSNQFLILNNPVDDFAKAFFLPVLQYTFLFIIMGLILILFINVFLYFTQLESQGATKKLIFGVILALVMVFWLQAWFYDAFSADLMLWGYFK